MSSQNRVRFPPDCRCSLIATEAKLVFATTTPVPEGANGRIAGDARRFNDAALEVLLDYPGIVVNDLYAFTKPHHEQWMSKPGNVHYNELGRSSQGKEVARVISGNL